MSREQQHEQCMPTHFLGPVTKTTRALAQEQATARSHMYCLLAEQYLHPPNDDRVQQLLDNGFQHELTSLIGFQPSTTLKKSVLATEEVSILRQEYMDLFVVPSSRYVAPFEDVYRGRPADGATGGGLLMGELIITLRKRYREAGAQMVRDCRQLPNHIGVELSFMSFLCDKETVAIGNGGYTWLDRGGWRLADPVKYHELQINFLQEHLNEWAPRLSRSIQAHTKSHFYHGLALFTEEFLAWDAARLLAMSYSKRS